MKKSAMLLTAAALSAGAVHAQSPFSYEAGLLGHFTKFEAITTLDNGLGLGGNVSTYLLRRLAIDLSSDFSFNKSAQTGTELSVLQNRASLIYNHPLRARWRGMIGAGWTGTKFNGDTTDNEYDSGLNALIGIRYCQSDNWSWTAQLIGDFKDPSDQAPPFTATKTWNVRVGLSRFFGANRSKGPCVGDAPLPPPPPPARTAAPAQQPAAQPAPPPAAPPPQPQPQPARQEPPPQPAPRPAPPPAPAPRPLMTFAGVLFDFDRSELKPAARDTIDALVRFLNDNPGSSVQVIGHTDDRGTDEYNTRLGDRRAESVRDYLVSKGISASRITTASRGESDPETSNATSEGRARNRRVVALEVRP